MSLLCGIINEHETAHKPGHQTVMATAICYSVHLQCTMTVSGFWNQNKFLTFLSPKMSSRDQLFKRPYSAEPRQFTPIDTKLLMDSTLGTDHTIISILWSLCICSRLWVRWSHHCTATCSLGYKRCLISFLTVGCKYNQHIL